MARKPIPTPPVPKISPIRQLKEVKKLSENELLLRTLIAEAEGEGTLGMALVARAILNRKEIIDSGTPVGKFKAKDKTIKGILLGDGQFQPVTGDYRVTEKITNAQKEKAKEALELAKNPRLLENALNETNLSNDEIKTYLNVTGFRTENAPADISQTVNNIKFKNHIFNTAGNKKRDVIE